MVVNINPCASIYDETLQALKFSAIATQVRCTIALHCTSNLFIRRQPHRKRNKTAHLLFQLVHGPSTKTRVAYILSLLREPMENGNESTVLEEEEDESDVEDEDITTLNTEVTFSALNVYKVFSGNCFKNDTCAVFSTADYTLF